MLLSANPDYVILVWVKLTNTYLATNQSHGNNGLYDIQNITLCLPPGNLDMNYTEMLKNVVHTAVTIAKTLTRGVSRNKVICAFLQGNRVVRTQEQSQISSIKDVRCPETVLQYLRLLHDNASTPKARIVFREGLQSPISPVSTRCGPLQQCCVSQTQITSTWKEM